MNMLQKGSLEVKETSLSKHLKQEAKNDRIKIKLEHSEFENKDFEKKAEAESNLENFKGEETRNLMKNTNEEHFVTGFRADYQKIVVKNYSSTFLTEGPMENIKTIFKTSMVELEKQKYYQQIFENIIINTGKSALKDLQAQYIERLRDMSDIEIFTCSFCGYETINITTLNCHFYLHHNNKTEHEILKCNKCNYETSFPRHITRHLTIHQGKMYKKAKEETEKYPCLECKYQGRSEKGLKKHMQSHKEKTNCDLCPFKSQDKNDIKRHSNTHKNGDKYQCYECDYTSSNKLPLARHLLDIHQITNEASKRRKICEICSKSFNTIYQLNVHFVAHKSLEEMSETEVYKCKECGHQTKYKANFKLHMLVHKAPEFICDKCGFASKHKQSYKNHLITHKRLSEINWFQCTLCPYKCRTKAQIGQHMKKDNHRDKNLRHIRNRDRIREAEEEGQVFVKLN